MTFPITRMRRLRGNPLVRRMVRETRLHVSNLIMPLFVVPGSKVRKPIGSMPGQFNLSVDMAVEEAKRIRDLGIPAALLFAIPDFKDETGSAAWQDDGIIQQTIRGIKEQVSDLSVITDLCFCEYTSHGHCGIMHGEKLDNDATLEIIVKQTLSHARAGADMIAPSGMIDGAVGAIRKGLDQHSFSDVPIMAYSAKFASAFYGPFREAVQSAPQFGDRKSYQMDPANIEEALREVALDIEEGADIVMVKPAMAFLDVLHAVKTRFQMPTAAYNVSGEYAMVKAAAEKGWIDGNRIMLEILNGIRRAGADMIISYFAMDYAKQAKGGVVEY
jgi:porphobilinogen synthase